MRHASFDKIGVPLHNMLVCTSHPEARLAAYKPAIGSPYLCMLLCHQRCQALYLCMNSWCSRSSFREMICHIITWHKIAMNRTISRLLLCDKTSRSLFPLSKYCCRRIDKYSSIDFSTRIKHDILEEMCMIALSNIPLRGRRGLWKELGIEDDGRPG